MSDEPLAMRAMQRIEDHMAACADNYTAMTRTFTDVKDAIKDTNRLLMAFIGFVIVTVVSFAGYTYTQNTALAAQLAQTRAVQAQTLSQIPDVTASKVAATVKAQQPEN